MYDDLLRRLKSIKKLPVLILNKTLITGSNDIKKALTAQPSNPKGVSDNLSDFWNDELFSKDDNEEGDVMENVKQHAMNMTAAHRQKSTSRPKTMKSIPNDDNVSVSSEKISDLITDDPMMKKFWENQEESTY